MPEQNARACGCYVLFTGPVLDNHILASMTLLHLSNTGGPQQFFGGTLGTTQRAKIVERAVY